MELIFTDEALDDLEYIHDFLIAAGVVQADEIEDPEFGGHSQLD